MATTAELIPQVRFFLGNLSTTVISDADMTIIIDGVLVNHPDGTDCDQLYYSTVATLQWLIREEAGGSGGGSGEVSKRTEKEGNVTVTEEYEVTGTSTGWDKVLSDLLATPNSIGCVVTPTVTEGGGFVIIGTTAKEPCRKTALNFRCGGKYNINRHWC
jgi:hypothetical protein